MLAAHRNVSCPFSALETGSERPSTRRHELALKVVHAGSWPFMCQAKSAIWRCGNLRFPIASPSAWSQSPLATSDGGASRPLVLHRGLKAVSRSEAIIYVVISSSGACALERRPSHQDLADSPSRPQMSSVAACTTKGT